MYQLRIMDSEVSSFISEMELLYGAEFTLALLKLRQQRGASTRKIVVNSKKIKVIGWFHELWVCERVHNYAISLGLDFHRRKSLVIAALLHDLYEDFLDELLCFDVEIRNLVFMVSKNHHSFSGFNGMNEDGMVLKTADRVINLTTCVGVFSINKIKNYIAETDDMIASFENKYGLISGFCVTELNLAREKLKGNYNEDDFGNKSV